VPDYQWVLVGMVDRYCLAGPFFKVYQKHLAEEKLITENNNGLWFRTSGL
jgi:hypothetical protein